MIAEINHLNPVPDKFRLIVLIALSCPSQIGTAVRIRIGEAMVSDKMDKINQEAKKTGTVLRHSDRFLRFPNRARQFWYCF
jgi:hypothetical protein